MVPRKGDVKAVQLIRVMVVATVLLVLNAMMVMGETETDDLEREWFEKLGHGYRVVAFRSEILLVESIPGERFEFEALEANDPEDRSMDESMLYEKMRMQTNDRSVVRLMEPNSKLTVAQSRMTATEGRYFGEIAVGTISNGLRIGAIGSHQSEISTTLGSLSGRGVQWSLSSTVFEWRASTVPEESKHGYIRFAGYWNVADEHSDAYDIPTATIQVCNQTTNTCWDVNIFGIEEAFTADSGAKFVRLSAALRVEFIDEHHYRAQLIDSSHPVFMVVTSNDHWSDETGIYRDTRPTFEDVDRAILRLRGM